MGHYAAEMMCDTCGNMRCTCPPEPKKPNSDFIVTDDYRVVTVDEFDALYARPDMNPCLFRMGKKQFKKRANAEKHAMEMCEFAVGQARAALLHLKRTLKTVRPWEKK